MLMCFFQCYSCFPCNGLPLRVCFARNIEIEIENAHDVKDSITAVNTSTKLFVSRNIFLLGSEAVAERSLQNRALHVSAIFFFLRNQRSFFIPPLDPSSSVPHNLFHFLCFRISLATVLYTVQQMPLISI